MHFNIDIYSWVYFKYSITRRFVIVVGYVSFRPDINHVRRMESRFQVLLTVVRGYLSNMGSTVFVSWTQNEGKLNVYCRGSFQNKRWHDELRRLWERTAGGCQMIQPSYWRIQFRSFEVGNGIEDARQPVRDENKRSHQQQQHSSTVFGILVNPPSNSQQSKKTSGLQDPGNSHRL